MSNESIREKFYNDMETLKLEKMRYNNNSLSYKIGLLGIVCSLLAMFFGLNSVNPNTFGTVLAILINIFVFLFGFLSSEKVKVYQIKYSYTMLGLAGICFARIFWYPVLLFRAYSKFMKIFDGTQTGYDAAAKANSNLGASMVGKFVVDRTEDGVSYGHIESTGYLTTNGNVRGALIVIFLAVATAAFATAAIINIKKSKELNAYLQTVEKKDN